MNLNQQTLSETVEVEAGKVADIETGVVRSKTMEAHYAQLEESRTKRRAREAAAARRNKIVRWLLLLALPLGGAIYFATSEGAQRMVTEAVADHGLAAFVSEGTESTGAGRTSLERERKRDQELEEHTGHVRKPEDLERTR